MEKKMIYCLLALAAFYGGVWLFNHVNAWLGIAAVLVVAYVSFKLIYSTIKKQLDDEKE